MADHNLMCLGTSHLARMLLGLSLDQICVRCLSFVAALVTNPNNIEFHTYCAHGIIAKMLLKSVMLVLAMARAVMGGEHSPFNSLEQKVD